MKRKKKVIVIGILALGAVIISAMALNGGGTPVETVASQRGTISRTVVDTGYVQPSTSHEIHATQSARVVSTPVSTGQPVTKGQILVVLENLDLGIQISDARWQLSQASANAEAARAAVDRTVLELGSAEENYSRTEELHKAGAVSKTEYEKALLQVETLRQTLKEQRLRLDSAVAQASGLGNTLKQLSAKESQLVIVSPASGTVLSLPVQAGQMLNPGTMIVSVAAPDSLEVKADILSDDLAEVREGQKVEVSAPVLGGKTLVGHVKQIYPRAEEKISTLGVAQRRVPVIVALEDPGNLKPGYEVRVAIETDTRQNVLMVPRSTLRTTAGGSKEVMLVSGDRIARRAVQTGIGNREYVEITGGLGEGDMVVKDGSLDLQDKAKVKTDSK